MTWFRVDDRLHSHRKRMRAGVPAMGLWVLAGSWCGDHLSDGFIPDYVALSMDIEAETHAAALVAAGLWEEAEQDGERGWQFHEWGEHQPARETVLERREQDRVRKAAARAAKAGPVDAPQTPAGVPAESERTPSGHVAESALPDPSRPDPLPTEEKTLSSATAAPRPDVEELCKHLASRIEANGSKRPTITKAWRDAARLLLDRDGRDADQVHRLIDWTQDDPFWRSNVMSMPKFREKYDQLRLRAVDDWRQRNGAAGSGRPTPSQRVASIAEIGLRLQAEDDAREAARREVEA